MDGIGQTGYVFQSPGNSAPALLTFADPIMELLEIDVGSPKKGCAAVPFQKLPLFILFLGENEWENDD